LREIINVLFGMKGYNGKIFVNVFSESPFLKWYKVAAKKYSASKIF